MYSFSTNVGLEKLLKLVNCSIPNKSIIETQKITNNKRYNFFFEKN